MATDVVLTKDAFCNFGDLILAIKLYTLAGQLEIDL